jgi:hypothetical protein
MQIIDYRKGKYKDIQAEEILNRILENTPDKYLYGIKKIILLDTDYKNENAGGRWIKKKADLLSEIEIMFDSFDIYPEEMIGDEKTIVFELGKILFHEIYHNEKYKYKLKKLKHNKNEEEADLWGMEKIVKVMNKMYPSKELKDWKRDYYQLMGW